MTITFNDKFNKNIQNYINSYAYQIKKSNNTKNVEITKEDISYMIQYEINKCLSNKFSLFDYIK